MKVSIEQSHLGGLLISPKEYDAKVVISRFMEKMKGTEGSLLYIDEAQVRNVRRTVLSFLTEEQWDEIEDGYTVTAEGDTWQLLHLWGWDAHTLSENGKV